MSPIVDACRQVVRVPINDMGIKVDATYFCLHDVYYTLYRNVYRWGIRQEYRAIMLSAKSERSTIWKVNRIPERIFLLGAVTSYFECLV